MTYSIIPYFITQVLISWQDMHWKMATIFKLILKSRYITVTFLTDISV